MYTSSKTKTMSTTNNENDDDDSNKAPFLEIGVDVADGEAAKNVVEKAVADLQMTMNLTPSSNNNASSPFKLEHHAKGVPVYSSSAYGPSPLVKERGCLLW